MKIMKKMLSILLVLSMILPLFSVAVEANSGSTAYSTVAAPEKGSFAVALKEDGSVWVWEGSGNYRYPRTPTKMIDSGVVAVGTSGGSVVVLKADGSLWAFGGTLNKGSAASVQIDTNVTSLYCQDDNIMYATSDGILWAYNPYNANWKQQIMNGNRYVSYIPIHSHKGYGIKEDGSAWMWDANDELTEQKLMDNVASITTSGSHTLFVKTDGSLWAIGDNFNGAIGNGKQYHYYSNEGSVEVVEPLKVMDDVVMAAADDGLSAAVKKDGSLWMWGNGGGDPFRLGFLYDRGGQIDWNALASPNRLVDSGIAAVALGEDTAFAVRQDGTLLSWGEVHGPLGYPSNERIYVRQPTAIPGMNGIKLPTAPQTTLPPSTSAASGNGWKQDSIGWWYQNANGSYPANAWFQESGIWYHFNASGYMQTGWINDGGTWYYLNPSGAMATGWIKDGGKDYYLSSSGAMLVNTTTPDGYHVDQNGVWVP